MPCDTTLHSTKTILTQYGYTEAYATSPFQSALPTKFFPTEGRWSKEMGTLTFLLISTFPLLFNLKCQLLLHKREDHKCKKKKRPFIKVEEMTRQRLKTHPRQNNVMEGRLFLILIHGIVWFYISFIIL